MKMTKRELARELLSAQAKIAGLTSGSKLDGDAPARVLDRDTCDNALHADQTKLAADDEQRMLE